MSKCNSSGVVYRVEARTTYPQPQRYAGMLLGHNWQEVNFNEAPVGVPNHIFNSAGSHGFLSYEAAQALRWWFAASEPFGLCVETRLVAYDYIETWEATRKAESEPLPAPRRPWDSFTPVQPETQEDQAND